MNPQFNKPVPTSILDYQTAQMARQVSQQQQGSSTAGAPQISAEGHQPTLQRSVVYPHGYPTPPSRSSLLSPVYDLQSQEHPSWNTQGVALTSSTNSYRPNPASGTPAYAVPPERQSGSQPSGNAPLHAVPFTVATEPQPQASHSSASASCTPLEGSSFSNFTAPQRQRPSSAPDSNLSANPSGPTESAPLPPLPQGAFVAPSVGPTSRTLSQTQTHSPHPPPPSTSTTGPPPPGSAPWNMAMSGQPALNLSHPPSGSAYQPTQQGWAVRQPALNTSQSHSGSFSQPPIQTNARPPNAHLQVAHIPTQSQTRAPLSTVLESAWAGYTHDLEQKVASLEAWTRDLTAEKQRLMAGASQMVRDLRGKVQELEGQVKHAREEGVRVASAALQKAHATEQRLQRERDDARTAYELLRSERDGFQNERNLARQECEQLRSARDRIQSERDAAWTECGQLRNERDALDNERGFLKRRNAELETVAQGLKERQEKLKGIVQERDELKPRVHPQVTIKTDPALMPKPESIDDLELQYPPETPAPIAVPEERIPITPVQEPSPASASPTFWTGNLSPDRKRSRAEYEADSADSRDAHGAGAGTVDVDADVDASRATVRARLEPELPYPELPTFQFPLASVDIKGLNSPVKWFMEVRRKEGRGSG